VDDLIFSHDDDEQLDDVIQKNDSTDVRVRIGLTHALDGRSYFFLRLDDRESRAAQHSDSV
jgi:hypothetical protein